VSVKRPTITAAMKLAVLRRRLTLVACAKCWCDFFLEDIEFDHHLAIIDGGAHTVENLRPLCGKCHALKSAREHKANCKAKRLAAGPKKSKHPLKSRGFDKTLTKKFSGEVVKRD